MRQDIKWSESRLIKLAQPAGVSVGAVADAGAAVAGMGSTALRELLPYVVLVPAILGAGAGWAASSLTSPTDTEVKDVQKDLYLSAVQMQTAKVQRDLEMRARLRKLDAALARNSRKKTSGRDPFVML